MNQCLQDIEDLKRELAESRQINANFEKQQSEFKSVGPLMHHIENLTALLHEKDVELATAKTDREEFRLNSIQLREECDAVT